MDDMILSREERMAQQAIIAKFSGFTDLRLAIYDHIDGKLIDATNGDLYGTWKASVIDVKIPDYHSDHVSFSEIIDRLSFAQTIAYAMKVVQQSNMKHDNENCANSLYAVIHAPLVVRVDAFVRSLETTGNTPL